MRIALFITCVGDTLFPRGRPGDGRAARASGRNVVFPREQTCCGQMHVNSGYPDAGAAARAPLRRAVRRLGYEAIVAPSASCVAMVREQYRRARRARRGDAALAQAVAELAPRVFELSELPRRRVLGVEDVGAYYPHRVTYHPTCHSLRPLRVGDAPLRLLRAVRGIELVELPEADECCGFGGTFAVKNADMSAAMLADKIARDPATPGPRSARPLDSSCLMHIGGGLRRQRAGVRAVHLAEILASTEATVAA